MRQRVCKEELENHLRRRWAARGGGRATGNGAHRPSGPNHKPSCPVRTSCGMLRCWVARCWPAPNRGPAPDWRHAAAAATTHCTSTSAAVLVREAAHALLSTRRCSTHLSLCLVCVGDARGAHGLARGPVAAVKLVAGRVAGGVAGSVLQRTRGSEAWTARPSLRPAACRRCMEPRRRLPGCPAALPSGQRRSGPGRRPPPPSAPPAPHLELDGVDAAHDALVQVRLLVGAAHGLLGGWAVAEVGAMALVACMAAGQQQAGTGSVASLLQLGSGSVTMDSST
jgi:hypothetical protein